MSSAQITKMASVQPANIEWRDKLPFSLEFNDVYYSDSGALEESQYVFIEGCQLKQDWQDSLSDSASHSSSNSLSNSSSNSASDDTLNYFYLGELGFGSGLNFFNCATLWRQINDSNSDNKRELHYFSIEKRPFSLADFEKSCANWPQFEALSRELIRQYPSTTYGRHRILFTQWQITLTLFFMPVDDALADLLQESQHQQNKIKVDHWFLDGFAPNKNNDMWAQSVLESIAKLSKANTRLATYSVAGPVKKAISAAGFKITKRAGFGRKREMLTATLTTDLTADLSADLSTDSANSSNDSAAVASALSQHINIKFERPWFNLCRSQQAERVAIIGGGIAGCATAYQLNQQGFKVDLYQAVNKLGAGASGAAAGIFHPQLTADFNLGSQFNWLAYLSLINFLSSLTQTEKDKVILSQGVDRFLSSTTLAEQLNGLSEQFHLTRWIKPLTRFQTSKRGVYFPHAASINMSQLCALLWDKISPNNRQLFLASHVNRLDNTSDGYWLTVNQKRIEKPYRHIVLCAGAETGAMTGTGEGEQLQQHYIVSPTNTSRGQTCTIKHPELARQLNHTLCEKAYIVPKSDDQLQIGTTFENIIDNQLNENSQQQLLLQCAKFLAELKLPFLTESQILTQPLSGTFGYRLHSTDRLPMVGGVVNSEKLKQDFITLGQRKILRSTVSDYNQAGLWLNTAYGSHGLLYSLLASQHLAALIGNDISPLQTSLANAIHPARFLIRQLKK